MILKELKCNSFNITIVYRVLSIDNISFDTIRKTFGNSIMLHQLPDNTVIVQFNDKPINCNFSQRRLIVSGKVTDNLSYIFGEVADIVTKLDLAVSNTEIVAFGFNYDGEGEFEFQEENSAIYLRNKFLTNWQDIEKSSGGKVTCENPNFTIDFDSFEYNINIRAIPNSKSFTYHANTHFPETQLLDKEHLVKKMDEHFNKFADLLKKL